MCDAVETEAILLKLGRRCGPRELGEGSCEAARRDMRLRVSGRSRLARLALCVKGEKRAEAARVYESRVAVVGKLLDHYFFFLSIHPWIYGYWSSSHAVVRWR